MERGFAIAEETPNIHHVYSSKAKLFWIVFAYCARKPLAGLGEIVVDMYLYSILRVDNSILKRSTYVITYDMLSHTHIHRVNAFDPLVFARRSL